MDFRQVNKCLVWKPYTLPKILDIIQSLEGFEYATTLDLSMGYYTIHLDKVAQTICTIMTLFGSYAYTRLPMGIMTAPDIFQQKMLELMIGMEYIRVYLDDLLLMSGKSFEHHLEILERVLQCLSNAGLRVNSAKCRFAVRK